MRRLIPILVLLGVAAAVVCLWLALSAALPADWSMIQVYFGITIILSLVGWCGLARVVRGQILQLRDQDFVTAARCAGASDRWIIFRHLLPNTMSYLIVSITLAIPGMILGETALSFLGLGIQPPAADWGSMVRENLSGVLLGSPAPLLPAVGIGVLTIGVNLLVDWMSSQSGRSISEELTQ